MATRCRSTATAATCATGATWRTTAGPSTWCCATVPSARSTTSAPVTRSPTASSPLKLLALVGRDDSYIEPVTDRLGHDRRYSIATDEDLGAGLAPAAPAGRGDGRTVAWYRDNRSWWEPLQAATIAPASTCAPSSPAPRPARSRRRRPCRRRATRWWPRSHRARRDRPRRRALGDHDRAAPRRGALRRLDRGRRLRGRSRRGPSRQRRWRCVRWPRRAAAPAPTSCTCPPTTCSPATSQPYHEWDPTARSVYGASKLAGEQEAAAAGIGATDRPTSWVGGEHTPTW